MKRFQNKKLRGRPPDAASNHLTSSFTITTNKNKKNTQQRINFCTMNHASLKIELISVNHNPDMKV